MVTEFRDDVCGLVSWINASGKSITFIDGECRSGKSWLATALSQFGIAPLDLDTFIERDTGYYVGALDTAAALRELGKKRSKSTAISCICARDVAVALRISEANFVYVIRMNELGLEEYSPAHDVERDGEAGIDPAFLPPDGTASKEIFDYHARVKPISRADVVFRNTVPDVSF